MKQPKIRLKGFEGEWNSDAIGNIATFSKGRGYSKSDLKAQGNPIVLYGRMYTNYTTIIKDVDTYASIQNGSVFSKGNEVIIPGSGETPEDIAIASYVEQKGVLLGGDLNIVSFNTKIITPAFAAMSISYSKTHYELSGYAQGKTVVHLHNGSISKGHLSYPSKEEQLAIVSFISSIDSLIQSTTKKIESLKQLKLASLQSMFPQEGETTPRVRFKGFEGEWEKTTFDKSVIVNSGRDYKHLSEGIIPVYGTGGYMLSVNESLSEIDAIGIGRKGTIDKPQLLKAPFWTVDTLFFMTPKKDVDLFFLFAVSEQINWRKYDESTGVPSLSKLTIGNIEFAMPQKEEQQAIGAYFTSLDTQITYQSQRLEKLKQIKSACLDNMFV